VKRILANVINIGEGLLFAVILYFGVNLKGIIRLDFLFYFLICFMFTNSIILITTKRKTLGEVFLKIRVVRQNDKDTMLILLLLREFLFSLFLILVIHDPVVWSFGFLVFTVPYNYKVWLNGLDFLFNTKYVDDSIWQFSQSL